jgi:hypothetical protein
VVLAELRPVQLIVAATQGEQLEVLPALDDAAVLDYQDQVGGPYRR